MYIHRWIWQSNKARNEGNFFPITENIVVNHFYRNNPNIWTPWMVRFAYETGICLFVVFPFCFVVIYFLLHLLCP